MDDVVLGKVEAIVARHLDDLLAFARIAVRRLDDA